MLICGEKVRLLLFFLLFFPLLGIPIRRIRMLLGRIRIH
jgi:hypothetical protein